MMVTDTDLNPLEIVSMQAGGQFSKLPSLEEIADSSEAKKHYLIALVGPSGSGKDEMLKRLVMRYNQQRARRLSPVSKLTSRPEREGENYVVKKTVDFFKSMRTQEKQEGSSDMLLMWRFRNDDKCKPGYFYGISKTDMARALLVSDAIIAITQPLTFEALMAKELPVKILPILIYPSNPAQLEERLKFRERYNLADIRERCHLLSPAWNYFWKREESFVAVVLNDNPSIDLNIGKEQSEDAVKKRAAAEIAINHAIETTADTLVQILSVYDTEGLRNHDILDVGSFHNYFKDEITRRLFGLRCEGVQERTENNTPVNLTTVVESRHFKEDPMRFYLAQKNLRAERVEETERILRITFCNTCSSMYGQFTDEFMRAYLGRFMSEVVSIDTDGPRGLVYRCKNPDQRRDKKLHAVELYLPF